MSKQEDLSDLKKIIQRYLAGEATSREKEFLKEYYEYFGNRENVLDKLTPDERQNLGTEMEVALMRHISGSQVAKFNSTFRRTAIAASVIILITFSAYFILRPHSSQIAANKERISSQDVLPGGKNAILTLSDGSSIVLNSARNGVLVQQGNMAVKKTADGKLIYDLSGPGKSDQTAIPGYNTISTPAGGEYQVILPDGSRVWLNAESSLKFPVVFSGDKRCVELKGEGYFEVAKNAKLPFSVVANNMKVEVLGTHFNIMAYSDEGSVNTTLLEGSVRIINGNELAMLIPGQEARVNKNINVRKADIREAIGWKEGYFIFKNEELKSVMRKLSRWYNVDIRYQGEIPVTFIGGRVSRYKNISEVLKMLELTGSIYFRIENPPAGVNKTWILVTP